MTPHLSNEVVQRFHAQALASGDKAVIYDHILGCEPCRLRIVDPNTQSIAIAAMAGHLLPVEDEEPYHLDYETIEGFVDDKLDAGGRSTARMHLEDCAECSAEVEDLRESLATMKAAARKGEFSQTEVSSPRRRLAFGVPLRIAAMIAIVAFAALAILVVWRWRMSGTNVPGSERTTGYQPTPLVSPQNPGFAPSPGIVNPPKVAGNPPIKGPGESPTLAAATLMDGAHEISIDKGGNVVGLPPLPIDSQIAVKEALQGESLSRPTVLDDVASADVAVRAPNGNEDRIVVVSPSSTVVPQAQPTLRWLHSKTASGYRVEIADETFRQIAKSDDLPSTTESWRPSVALQRGQIYTWTIRALNGNGEPSELTSHGKFKVLSEGKLKELDQLKTQKSHLALGLFYAREGMLADAEREFGILVKDNPNSPIAKKLLQEVRAWRKR